MIVSCSTQAFPWHFWHRARQGNLDSVNFYVPDPQDKVLCNYCCIPVDECDNHFQFFPQNGNYES